MVAAAIGASAVGSLAGSALSAGAAGSAASAQEQAANNATALQQSIYNQNSANEAPFLQSGIGAQNLLDMYLGITPASSLPSTANPTSVLTGGTATGGQGGFKSTIAYPSGTNGETTSAPSNVSPAGPTPTNPYGSSNPLFGSLLQPFTAADFQAQPGYQFQLAQGEQALNNQNSATGNLLSGGGVENMQSFVQGLASTDYQQQFQNWLTQQNNIYSRLAGVANQGQAAASQQANSGVAFGNQAGSNMIGAGNAAAAGTVGTANAISSGLSGAGNNALLYAMMGQNGNNFNASGVGYGGSAYGYSGGQPYDYTNYGGNAYGG